MSKQIIRDIELDRIAKDLATDIIVVTHKKSTTIKSNIHHKANYIIERVIEELKKNI